MAGTILTRRELYGLVWSTPLSKLAVQFNISGRGLAKLCHRHEIPTPGRAYWAKRLAGRSEAPPPLSVAVSPDMDIVNIDAASSRQRGALKRLGSQRKSSSQQRRAQPSDWMTEVGAEAERKKAAKALPRRDKQVWFVGQVKDWDWTYDFGLASPDRVLEELFPNARMERYWERNVLTLSCVVRKPRRFKGRRMMVELRAIPELHWNGRDHHTTQSIGELWSNEGVFSGDVLIPHHVVGHLMQALSLGLPRVIVLETNGLRGITTSIMDVGLRSSIEADDYDS